jgi:hypothetical protein
MPILRVNSGTLNVNGDLEIQVAAPTQFSAVILADSPVGYWRQEDSSGDITDSSSNGYDLAPTATPVYSQAGQVDNSINYQNGPTRANITDAASSNAFDLLNNLTLEAWVFPIGNQANNGGIIAKNNHSGSVGSHNYTLDWQTLNVPRLQVNISNPNTNYQVVAAMAVTLSAWTHVVGVRDGTNLFMYIDGALDNTTVIPSSALTDTSQIFTIGCNSPGTSGHVGRLDEVAVYNFALSPTRILAHYNARNLPG